MKNKILNYLNENYEGEEIMLADGFEEAWMGIVQSKGSSPKSLYNEDVCIDILMERDGMSLEEATEFFQFNVADAYVGEATPAFVCLSDTTREEGEEDAV